MSANFTIRTHSVVVHVKNWTPIRTNVQLKFDYTYIYLRSFFFYNFYNKSVNEHTFSYCLETNIPYATLYAYRFIHKITLQNTGYRLLAYDSDKMIEHVHYLRYTEVAFFLFVFELFYALDTHCHFILHLQLLRQQFKTNISVNTTDKKHWRTGGGL